MPDPKDNSLPILPDERRMAAIQRGQDTPARAAESTAGSVDAPGPAAIDPRALEEKVIAAIKTIYDPEIPVNIYELGLIYGIDITPSGAVTVRMTLTAPSCPVAESLPLEVQAKVSRIPEVTEAKIDLVWDPPWTRDHMSEAAKLALGMF